MSVVAPRRDRVGERVEVGAAPPRRPVEGGADACRGRGRSRTPRRRSPTPPRPGSDDAALGGAERLRARCSATAPAQQGDPVAAAGLVDGEDVRAVHGVAVEVGTAERRQDRVGGQEAQAEAAAAQPDRVGGLVGEVDRPGVVLQVSWRGVARDGALARRRGGDQPQDGCMPFWWETRCRSSA